MVEQWLREQLVGKNMVEAKTLLESKDLRFRISRIDGEPQILTCDYRPDRLNLEITDGVIVGVTLG